GRADLYLFAGGAVRIHAQDGSGRFPEEPTWKGRVPKADGGPDEIRVRDLDGDGRAELFALGSSGGGLLSNDEVLEVLRGADPGPLLEAPAARFKFEGYGLYLECVDVDGDGVLDLALSVLDVPMTPDAIATGTRLKWNYHIFRGVRGEGVEREGSLRFTEAWEPEAIAGLGMIATFGGDADGDGVADFLRVAPDGRLGVHRIVKTRSGRLEREERPLFEVPIERAAKDLAALRLDEDARTDAVVFHDDGFTTVLPR
ncbi:MAG TPA: VCBS repeat-containing protein, partial [Planctomycetota bacterium]|nr:VCBS repeat-containing protein [Planctomycetota bacterium]